MEDELGVLYWYQNHYSSKDLEHDFESIIYLLIQMNILKLLPIHLLLFETAELLNQALDEIYSECELCFG